jgi:2-polyprenyl-6-methoxyphenol hydroxylase-like FAD-dependent oxidoreductase
MAADNTACCIVGGGPAGMALGLLLARRGVDVTLLEARARWAEREFRGNTVNPASLEILAGAGMAEALGELRHVRAQRYVVQDAAGELVFADFERLGGPHPYVMMLPQSPLLELLAREATRYPNFRLVMGARARALVEDGRRVAGVEYVAGGERKRLFASLVVGADGRASTIRNLSGLPVARHSVAFDVLWWKVPRAAGDPEGAGTIFRLAGGVLLALMDHHDHWQVGYMIEHGARRRVEARGIEELRRTVAGMAPELADRVEVHPAKWGEVDTLPVVSDRLRLWHRPGLLLIGDAAHAASPIGGVGINLAIQDAAAAAEELAGELLGKREVGDRALARVQKRRESRVRLVQAAQGLCQRLVVSDVLGAPPGPYALPRWVRTWYKTPILKEIPTRLIARGGLR